MNNNDFHPKWHEVKQEVKNKYPHITDDDLACNIGEEKKTLLRLKAKMDANEKEIDKWLSILG